MSVICAYGSWEKTVLGQYVEPVKDMAMWNLGGTRDAVKAGVGLEGMQ